MSNPYPIVRVQPEWIREPEELGSRQKFWYRNPACAADWLFKHPREDKGEHWAEKVAGEVASVLGIRHARVELATFEGKRGSVTESFVHEGEALHLGNQVLEGVVHGYNLGKKFHQSSHTLEIIWQAIAKTIEPEGARRAKLDIAEFMVLDAVIGNTDRHHGNWGLLKKWIGSRPEEAERFDVVAPSFDHASSLGRELLDERRNTFLAEDRVGYYAEKGQGKVYWSENERRGPSPLELVRRAARTYPNLFQPALVKLRGLNRGIVSDLVNRIPNDWISPLAKRFAIELMCYNCEQLQELI